MCCRMEVIDADNERLSQQLAELKAMRAETDTQSNHPADNTPRKVTKRDLRPIPGMAGGNMSLLSLLSLKR